MKTNCLKMSKVICMAALGLGMQCVLLAQDVPADPDYRVRQGITLTPGGDNMPAETTVVADSAGLCVLPVIVPATAFVTNQKDGFPDCFATIVDRNGDSVRYFVRPQPEPKRLLIVDGRRVRSIKRIPADNIESFSIYSPEKAITLYGDKARNGVIVVKTKGKKK